MKIEQTNSSELNASESTTSSILSKFAQILYPKIKHIYIAPSNTRHNAKVIEKEAKRNVILGKYKLLLLL